MIEAQHSELPEDEEVTPADRLIIDSPDRDRVDRAEGPGAGARPDAASASRARRIKLQAADRCACQAGGSAAHQALIVLRSMPPTSMLAAAAIFIVDRVVTVEDRNLVGVSGLELTQTFLVGDARGTIDIGLALKVAEHQRYPH